jgi:hypothetical protein
MEVFVETIVENYCAAVIQEWTSDNCQVGAAVMTSVVSQFTTEMLGVDLPCESLKVLSGCRREKFLLHIVCPVLFDSNVVSRPLFVYELARAFSVENLQILVDHYKTGTDICHDDHLTGEEERFRLRALMLAEGLQWRASGEGHIFRGFEDTPFDEGIYTQYRALRAPGACKMGSDGRHGGAMIPLDGSEEEVRARLFGNVANFRTLFANGQTKARLQAKEYWECFRRWCSFLVNPPRDMHSDIVACFDVPDRFPFRSRWWGAVHSLGLDEYLD